MKRHWIIGLGVLAGGCSHHDIARAAQECEALTEKALPGDGSNPDRFAEQSRYALACMGGKGLRPRDDDHRCQGVGVEGSSIDAACFA